MKCESYNFHHALFNMMMASLHIAYSMKSTDFPASFFSKWRTEKALTSVGLATSRALIEAQKVLDSKGQRST
ncbi:hypothetical protein AC249_AIPGENE15251 [Exaiptasia diaphana]|nr:hypothetical protein AC249_AIPGENE15251 [Exaiptasia diaphana]